ELDRGRRWFRRRYLESDSRLRGTIKRADRAHRLPRQSARHYYPKVRAPLGPPISLPDKAFSLFLTWLASTCELESWPPLPTILNSGELHFLFRQAVCQNFDISIE